MFDSQSFLTTNPYSQWQKPTGGVGSSMDMSRVMQGSMNPVNSTWNIPTNTAMPVQPSTVQNSNQVSSPFRPQQSLADLEARWGPERFSQWLQGMGMYDRTTGPFNPSKYPDYQQYFSKYGIQGNKPTGNTFQRPPIQLNKPQGQQGNQTTNGLLAFLQQLMGGRR